MLTNSDPNSLVERSFGGFMHHMCQQNNFLNAINITNTFGYYNDKKFKDNDKNPQIAILNDGFIDPKTLTFQKRLRWTIKEFCYSTSCHGVPWIVDARNSVWRFMWTTLWLLCVTMFLYQGYKQIIRYNNNDKIVDIELKFDTIQFPAVTFCNMNPYKKSEAANEKIFMIALRAFQDALHNIEMSKKADKARKKRSQQTFSNSSAKEIQFNRVFKRMKRSGSEDHTEMSHSVCTCEDVDDPYGICDAQPRKEPEDGDILCFCAFARTPDDTVGDVYPCTVQKNWDINPCGNCDDHLMCDATASGSQCLCFMDNKFCNKIPDGETATDQLIKLWENYGKTPALSNIDPEFIKALGFATMTDELAITTRAQENTIFIAANIERQTLRSMIHPKQEFIKKCSFNGAQCDIEKDFQEILDPSFGGCYIYNYNRKVNRSSARAGSMYGLRVLLNTNSSEYLPTTESTGVRITVHNKEDYPFPDSFGYSAPTGTISSFGVTMRDVQRLSLPYGNCVHDARGEDFIYENYGYSIEACYRSCFQNYLVKKCGCGDPRIPVATGGRHCSVGDVGERECVERESRVMGGLHGDFVCSCPQACHQAVYSFSYSASQWPAGPTDMLGAAECMGTPDFPDGGKKCKEFNTENGVMVEVFYEQLNFESLQESSAYGFVNLLADFGGQLGLWMGVSVISVFEGVMLLYDLLWLTGRHYYKKHYKKDEARSGHYIDGNAY